MPSLFLVNGCLHKNFSSKRFISQDIAALKIFMAFCFLAKEVDGGFKVKATYDVLSKFCCLSRSLISKGLQKLKSEKIITVEGVKDKTYTLQGDSYKGWCKLPQRDLSKDDLTFPFMASFLNRYEDERSALKLYLYLLSVRSNQEEFTDVSYKKIEKKTGISILHISAASQFLVSIGLLDGFENLGNLWDGSVIRFWAVGYKYLPTIKKKPD
jgi:hypothetical protein